jgi:deoxyribonuclease-4
VLVGGGRAAVPDLWSERMYLGAHVRASGGVWNAIDNGAGLGAEAIQFFAGSPRTWKPMLYKEADAARFREKRAASAIRFVVIHTIYLINLATANDDFYRKSVDSLVGAVAAAEQLGAEAIVTHVGSHQGAGFEFGLRRVEYALGKALEECADSNVRVLLEDTAGAGGTMGRTFEDLRAIIDCVGGDPKIGLCLDTAHLYEAGYDIASPEGLEQTLSALEAEIGLERLVMLHLNDSKTPLGSNSDRHENIGHGHLGREAFAAIVNHPAFADLPGITEVPGFAGEGPDLRNMETLRILRR